MGRARLRSTLLETRATEVACTVAFSLFTSGFIQGTCGLEIAAVVSTRRGQFLGMRRGATRDTALLVLRTEPDVITFFRVPCAIANPHTRTYTPIVDKMPVDGCAG